MKELKSVEERILDRTLYLIGKQGSVHVPVRTIVKEADVNIGAINYYKNCARKPIASLPGFSRGMNGACVAKHIAA